jgi:hypothetical protein
MHSLTWGLHGGFGRLPGWHGRRAGSGRRCRGSQGGDAATQQQGYLQRVKVGGCGAHVGEGRGRTPISHSACWHTRMHALAAAAVGDPAQPQGWQGPLKAALTSGCLSAAGDLLAQRLTKQQQQPYEPCRTARMAGFGLCWYGPYQFYWYNLLEHLMPLKNTANFLAKVWLWCGLWVRSRAAPARARDASHPPGSHPPSRVPALVCLIQGRRLRPLLTTHLLHTCYAGDAQPAGPGPGHAGCRVCLEPVADRSSSCTASQGSARPRAQHDKRCVLLLAASVDGLVGWGCCPVVFVQRGTLHAASRG